MTETHEGHSANKCLLSARPLVVAVILICLSIFSHISSVFADQDACLVRQLKLSAPETTVSEIRKRCIDGVTSDADEKKRELGGLSKRILRERQSSWNRHVIAAHKRNYILPFYYSNNPNRQAYSAANDWADEIQSEEIKFQISLKVPLNSDDVFNRFDGFYFAITIASWWQLYADKLSAPFRETNYEPEFFYLTPIDFHPMGGNSGLQLGIVHQSNGRSQILSRSWNRLYAAYLFEKDDFALTFRPWYRLPEDPKDSPNASQGDDNPDIDEYLGYFDLTGAYRMGKSEISFLLRNNMKSDNKGALELGYSFPLFENLKGYVVYFNGYGDSLIDYNHRQQRLGIGLLLTDWL